MMFASFIGLTGKLMMSPLVLLGLVNGQYCSDQITIIFIAVRVSELSISCVDKVTAIRLFLAWSLYYFCRTVIENNSRTNS